MAFVCGLIGISCAVATGCASGEPRLAPLTQPITVSDAGARVVFQGRLRDARHAVQRSLPSAKSALLRESGSGPDGFFSFETVGLRGETGLVRMEFEPTDASLAANDSERPITLIVRVGAFAEPRRDSALASRIAREMLTLAPTERGLAVTE